MKSKNKIILSILAVTVLVSALVLGCIFAFGTEANENKINLMVSAPSDAIDAAGTFSVGVKITNENISAFNAAGFQVELSYDNSKLSVDGIVHSLDESESEALSYANEETGKVTFVCVKKAFSENQGYTTLTNLFTINFVAKDAISNPAALFNSDSIKFLAGDTSALKIELANQTYAGSIPKLAEAILNKGLDVVTNAKTGTVVVAPTPVGTVALTKEELVNSIGDNNVTVTNDKNGAIGTGTQITYNDGEETVTLIVKGDVDGDGIITVFDALLIKKAQNNDDANENFTDREVYEFAGDVDGDDNTNGDDAHEILDHVVGNGLIK